MLPKLLLISFLLWMFGFIHIVSTAHEFPFKLFLKDTGIESWNSTLWTDYKCGDRSWYNNLSRDKRYYEICDCDAACGFSGNCCMDFMWNPLPDENITTISVARHLNDLLSSTKSQSCLPFFPFSKVITDHFIMVDTCPSSSDSKERDKCHSVNSQSILSGHPVLGDDNFLYRNLHCAACNNVSSYHYPRMELGCDREPFPDVKEDDIEGIYESALCELLPSPFMNLAVYIPTCKPKLCTKTMAILCRLFTGTFYPKALPYDYYRNIFCAECIDVIIGGGEVRRKHGSHTGRKSWYKTVNVVDVNNIEKGCEKGQVKDTFGNCIKQQQLCGAGYKLKDEKCDKSFDGETGPKLKLHVFDKIDSRLVNCIDIKSVHLFLTQNTTLDKKFVDEFETTLFNMTRSNRTFNQHGVVWKGKDLANSFNLTALTKLTKITNSTIILSSSPNQINTTFHEYTRTFGETSLCASIIRFPVINTTSSNQTCHEIHLPNKTLTNFSSVNSEIKIQRGNLEEFIYFCEKYHLDSACFRQNIDPDNYTIDKNHSLIFQSSGKRYTFRVDEYVPVLKAFQICQKEYRVATSEKYHWKAEVDDANGIITLIGTIMSIIAYLVLFVVFCTLKALRNTGGTHTFVLVILLFIADIIFIVSVHLIDENTIVCKWIGVALHWSLLTVCVWSIVVALDIVFHFIRQTPVISNKFKRLRNRILLCIMSTLIVMAVVVYLNETETVRFHYEKNCWIGSQYPSLGFYFIPATLTYLICFVCLITTIRLIKRGATRSRKVLKGSSHTQINLTKICLQLMFLLGLSEIFGLVQIPISDSNEKVLMVQVVFGTIYNVARSFRGLLICIVYLSKKHTVDLMKSHLKCKKNIQTTQTGEAKLTKANESSL